MWCKSYRLTLIYLQVCPSSFFQINTITVETRGFTLLYHEPIAHFNIFRANPQTIQLDLIIISSDNYFTDYPIGTYARDFEWSSLSFSCLYASYHLLVHICTHLGRTEIVMQSAKAQHFGSMYLIILALINLFGYGTPSINSPCSDKIPPWAIGFKCLERYRVIQ